jgi:hypothetical protein
MELNGEDLRPLPLAEVLARKPLGIVFNEHTDEDGATDHTSIQVWRSSSV